MQQPDLSASMVLHEIKQLWIQNGELLSKRDVKKLHPEVMRSALYYYPSWEHAVSKAMDLE